MFESYWDDSGTHTQSDIAVAACYISTLRGWGDFVKTFDRIRREEDFDVFHMAEFVAPRDQGHKPFCDWDTPKKERVYSRIATAINENKRVGLACAVPKEPYDRLCPLSQQLFGKQHYTFGVRMLLNQIITWRDKSMIRLPMQYFFDWEMAKTDKRIELEEMWAKIHASWKEKLGFEDETGMSFQNKAKFKPLQAADILAWQVRAHMERILPLGHDDLNLAHPGFRLLREYQEMDLGFFTEDSLVEFEKMAEQNEKQLRDIVEKHGITAVL